MRATTAATRGRVDRLAGLDKVSVTRQNRLRGAKHPYDASPMEHAISRPTNFFSKRTDLRVTQGASDDLLNAGIAHLLVLRLLEREVEDVCAASPGGLEPQARRFYFPLFISPLSIPLVPPVARLVFADATLRRVRPTGIRLLDP